MLEKSVLLAHLPQHILSRYCAVLKYELTGVAAAHAQLVHLLRGAETLHMQHTAFLYSRGACSRAWSPWVMRSV